MRRALVLALLLTPALASAQGAIGVAGGGGGGGGAIPECSGDQSAFGVCLDTATGELVWEGATADGFEAELGFVDPTADGQMLFDVNSLTAQRTYTWQDASATVLTTELQGNLDINANGTIDYIAGGLKWSWGTGVAGIRMGDNGEFYVGNGLDMSWSHQTTATPDGNFLGVETASRSVHLIEHDDRTFDFNNGPGGASATTAPHLIAHSEDQNTDHYRGSAYYGTAGKWVTTLTESSATNVLTVPVADNASSGGEIQIKVFASDGSDHQARYTTLTYVAVNEGDTETCTLSGADETDDGNVAAITSGTLTYDWAFAGGTNACVLTCNAVSSLTQTTLEIEAQLIHVGAGEPLPF